LATVHKKNILDLSFSLITAVASLSIIFIIIGIFWILVRESAPAIHRFGIIDFLASTEWNPVKELFGAATNIYGTFITTALALLFAVPTAIGIAIFVTEVAPNFLKGPIGIAIGAESPEEIAVSITAELISHRNKRKG